MSGIVEGLPALELNLKTAGPLLRLLLAQHDLDDPCYQPDVAWKVFQLFCRLPARVTSDIVSFQSTLAPEDINDHPDPRVVYCTWSRELTESDEFGSASRAIQLQWTFDPMNSELEDVELWSADFPDLHSFFSAAEATPQFQALLRSDVLTSDIFTVDLEA
jgi:hypothetical protein